MNSLSHVFARLTVLWLSTSAVLADDSQPLWNLARAHASTHAFSTLFTAHDVRKHLSSDDGISQAIEWCKRSAVTHVYIETFRDGYMAERAALEKSRDRFRNEGFDVSGCVTPTQIGKKSNRWNIIACYTDAATQERTAEIFKYTASLFDLIMIDDFWFTDCSCAGCDAARAARQVTVGGKTTTAPGDTFEDYRRELMLRMSRECVLGAAKKENSRAKLIIKYPQWYDVFHERGYDVELETKAFDHIWVGTETRDYDDKRWGGTVQYEAYFIMRWLGDIGGRKCGGGWYDWLGTTEKTYVEQARQTVLGGARESLLFCYGGLQSTTGPKNIQSFRDNVPELLEVAKEISRREIIGIAAYKPANSHPGNEKRVFDFVGMLGLPLLPCHEFPANAPAAFFSAHALKDEGFARKLTKFIRGGKPVLITDGLAEKLRGKVQLDAPNVQVLAVRGEPKSLLALTEADLSVMRARLLRALNVTFKAPNNVALYLFKDGSWVIENFSDDVAVTELNGVRRTVPARGWLYEWKGRSPK
jgi:hypothetical protein